MCERRRLATPLKLAQEQSMHQVELICDRAQNCAFDNSSVVIMNYTLQFLPLSQRQTVLQRLYPHVDWSGLFYQSLIDFLFFVVVVFTCGL